MKGLFIGIVLFLPTLIAAQQNCKGSLEVFEFNSNLIKAYFTPQGQKFSNYDSKGFQAPYPGPEYLGAIIASAPWIGGYKDSSLHFAGQTYPGSIYQDFYLGPLGPGAILYQDVCEQFDRVWSVYREDILQHRNDFNANGFIVDTLPSVFGWPAQGNRFFEKFNGFELPENHNGGWADFKDLNGDNLYDPDRGEYPIIRLKGNTYIPEQIMWMVFNDQGFHLTSNADPLGVEIQLTVFAFYCRENEVLNNTLFNSYKIINQDITTIDSLYLGFFTDYDLGCRDDDFIGSDSVRNTEFIYNADDKDGDIGQECLNNEINNSVFPPVMSLTYLSHPMHSFISFQTPFAGYEFFRLLTGRWRNNSPITSMGTGYNPGVTSGQTNFLYHGDPRDSTQWSEISEMNEGGDPRTVSSVYLNKLEPNQSVIVETAYSFHMDSIDQHLGQIGVMYSNVDYLINSLSDIDVECSLYPVCLDGDCVWPGDFNRDGIVNHVDLLYWGVMKDNTGSSRNGLISWRGHYAEDWDGFISGILNYKHGDSYGDGSVDPKDLEINLDHFNRTNELYNAVNTYPQGPELVLTSHPIDPIGRIRGFKIEAGQDIDNILGMAYEIEFDTSIFEFDLLYSAWPDSNSLGFWGNWGFLNYSKYNSFETDNYRYAWVQSNHNEITIPVKTLLQTTTGFGFHLKPGLTSDDIPDSTVIRLRNLVGINAQGEALHLGSNPLTVYNSTTAIIEYGIDAIAVYPNPSRDVIYLDVPFDVDAGIFNIQGQLIKRVSTDYSIDVSDLSPGIYYLKLPVFGKCYKMAVQ